MNQIIDAQPLVCEEDSAAIQQARRMVEDNIVELWEGDRKVARFDPDDDRDPAGSA